jgi:hypothetical protein
MTLVDIGQNAQQVWCQLHDAEVKAQLAAAD